MTNLTRIRAVNESEPSTKVSTPKFETRASEARFGIKL